MPPRGGDTVPEADSGGPAPLVLPATHSLPWWIFDGGEKQEGGWATRCELYFPPTVYLTETAWETTYAATLSLDNPIPGSWLRCEID